MAQQQQQTVLILGGGVGGVVTASKLRKKLDSRHRVILVDREQRHLFQPSLLWLMTGDRLPEKIGRDLSRLERKGIEIVTGEVGSIDPETRVVEVDGQIIKSDYLVVSLGANLAPEKIPGLAESGHNLYSLEGAAAIRDARMSLSKGNLAVVVTSMPFKCPAAPYEAAMLLEADLGNRGVREQVTVSLFSPELGPMGVAGPDVSAAVRGMVESKGIEYHPQHRLTEVDADRRSLRFDNGVEARFDFLVYVPPHDAPVVVRDAGLTNESGWVPVDRHTLETSFDGVFAIGDVTTIPLEMGLPLPKAGTFAMRQGEAVAQTIEARVSGRGEPPGHFGGFGECLVETGNGKAGIGRGNFYAIPAPDVKFRQPNRLWHWIKIWFEWRWLRRWF
ncbi:MAG: NAD(P)/FAD-dependent oxidoreductase [Chloroflexi bacterium]|nr:NAD(P)/FAD-dependent oxidoreductase [Chloroflexota bacterium]